MELIHRKINIEFDKEYLLERHCRINYECDSPWKRRMTYSEYRNEWFELENQINGFIDGLSDSLRDSRTIAEIIENEKSAKAAYIWIPFYADMESGFCFAEVQDIYIEEQFRNDGIATLLMEYAELKAKENGAKVIRSGTGCENIKSLGLHEKLGYYQYRYEFEKLL